MADGTELNPGTGGDVIATDDIGGQKYQRVKVNFGPDGSTADVSKANPLPVAAGDYTKAYARAANGNLTYEGWAQPGSATADPAWKIRKFTYDAQNNILTETWADGNTNFDNVWDDRAVPTYS